VLDTLDLDPRLFTPAALEYWGQISFLKGGVVFADRVNTVSETYCLETLTHEYGFGFEGILRSRGTAYSGILNGLDERQWDPATDAALAQTYSAVDLSGKAACKRALQQELGLRVDPAIPLIAMVTRLDTQKGLDLVEQAWEGLLERKVQLVLLGTGEEKHMRFFAGVQDTIRAGPINLEFDDAFPAHLRRQRPLPDAEPLRAVRSRSADRPRYGSIPVVRVPAASPIP
jgi:glycogen synthase